MKTSVVDVLLRGNRVQKYHATIGGICAFCVDISVSQQCAAYHLRYTQSGKITSQLGASYLFFTVTQRYILLYSNMYYVPSSPRIQFVLVCTFIGE